MTEQIPLPIDSFQNLTMASSLPKHRRIFVNRNLTMSSIEWIGFDMDYTLAIYDQEAMDRLSVDVTAERLVQRRGYPPWVAHIQFDLNYPIRGLLIDKKFGHVVKMDRYKAVGKAFRGMQPIDKEKLRLIYHSDKHRAPTARYHFIDTLYALSEATVYAGVIDAFDQRNLPVDHAKLFADIRETIDEAHRDGTIYAAITGNMAKYIKRDPDLAPTLHKMRSAGKKLFLLTNSRRTYTEAVMTYLLGQASSEYPSWKNFFDIVIVAACKPAFFQEHRPLLERIHEERDDSQMRTVQTFERNKMYEGGNLQDLERILGLTGDKILYVGDHIYGDILRSKKDSAWRTAMIIQEMDTEVSAHEACLQSLVLHTELEEKRDRLEDELRGAQSRLKELQRQIEATEDAPVESSGSAQRALILDLEDERIRLKRVVERVRGLLREIDAQTTSIEHEVDKAFHPYWGSLMKERSETSSFGDQVEEYACLYTSRVSNFLFYSPNQSFRSPRDLMPHEL